MGFVSGSVSCAQKKTLFSSLAVPPAWPASDKWEPGDSSGGLPGKTN